MFYHLRYTPYELKSDNLSEFCNKYERFIIAHERYKKDFATPTEPHFHIWIDSDLDLDSVRTAFKKAMSIPAGGRGRNNKYYSLEHYKKECYCYVVKQENIIEAKGVPMESLRVLPCCPHLGKGSPLKQEKKVEVQASKKKETNFWNEILERAILWEKSQGRKIELEDALKVITKVYFTKGLPLPHPGDRKRWAISLRMYSKMDWEYIEEKHDHIISDESATFIGEHMTANKPL